MVDDPLLRLGVAYILGWPRKKWVFPIFDFFEEESDFEYFLESHEENSFWKIGLFIDDFVCSWQMRVSSACKCREHT